MALRSEPTMFAGPDQVNAQAGRDCAADLYRQAGITDPRADFDMAEVYVPFSWYEPMGLEPGILRRVGRREAHRGGRHVAPRRWGHPVELLGWRAVVEPHRGLRDVALPRVGLQVRGLAGEHQVPEARRAFGQAYGGGSQFFAVWVVGVDKP